MGKHDQWTAQELQILRKLYSNTSNNELSGILGRTVAAIMTKASQLRLKKQVNLHNDRGRDPLDIIVKRQRAAGFLD